MKICVQLIHICGHDEHYVLEQGTKEKRLERYRELERQPCPSCYKKALKRGKR